MGYEIKLYAGEAISNLDGKAIRGETRFYVWGMFNLHKYQYESHLHNIDRDGEECFIFASNVNDKIFEDKYGDKLRAIPAERVIKALESDGEHWALASLKALRDLFDGAGKELSIVWFGY